MTRNGFIGRILSAWAAITSAPVVYAVVQYLIPPVRETAAVSIPAGKRSDLAPGTVRYIREGKRAFFVRETGHGQIRAFSARCTHLGCLVEYLEEDRKFRCNCHGSTFDENGGNLTGPAVRPLEPLRVEISGDDILINTL